MKKQRISPIFVAVWCIICVAISVSLLQHLKSISKATSRLAMMESQTQELEKKNEELQQKIEDARSPFNRERMIRDQLGMQKPGEVIVQIVDAPKGSESSMLQVDKKEEETGSTWDKIGQFFEQMMRGIKEKFIGR